MNLYLISQSFTSGYDTYDSAVVAAESAQEARETNPSEFVTHHKNGKWMGTYSSSAINGSGGKEYVANNSDWPSFSSINKVSVKFLGKTKLDSGVICASFNAG